MKKLKYGILPLLFLFSFLPLAKAQISQQKYETRAVWLTTLSGMDWPRTKATSLASREKQKKELTDILDKYQDLHLNTVLLQTRVRGSMIYPSNLEGWDPCLTGEAGKDPGYDPLQFAIEECHKRGLELHCWIVTIPSGSANVHRQLGGKTVTKTHSELVKKIKDYWYLDPGNPGTAEYLAKICEEITRNYDIDGMHFDFIRYPENSADILDRDSYRKYGKGQNRATWRRNNITNCVRAMYHVIKAIKPWVKVTCAPLGKYQDTDRYSSTGWNGYNKVYQESQHWLQEGIMDGLFPMAYYKGNHFYPFIHDWIENSVGRPIVPGLGIYFLSPREGNWVLSDIQRQMNYCRSQGLGIAHYRSKFLTDNTKGLFDWCKKTFYPYPSLVPPMNWQTKQQPNTPENLKISQMNGLKTLTWDAMDDDVNNTYVTYNVYRSENSIVNTASPQNLIATRLMVNNYQEENVGVNYHYAVTAVNRFGIESAPLQSVSAPDEGNSIIEYTSNKLKINFSENAKSILIADLSDRIIMECPFAPEISISDLQSGSYNISIITNEGVKKQLGLLFK